MKPVPEAHIESALPFMSRQVAALVRFQIHTGARPGEAVIVRTGDIDRSGRVWLFHPTRYKGEHRGHAREVFVGPKAQAVLLPWLRDDPEVHLFSPKEAESERNANRTANRKTPRFDSHMKRNAKKRKGSRPKGQRYSVDTYRQAIIYACERAGVPPWSPHQLRHNAATQMRKEFGIELAQLALGHASMTATQIYAERDRDKVMGVFEKVG